MRETVGGKFLSGDAQLVRTLREIKRAHDILTLALVADGPMSDTSFSLGLSPQQFADIAAYASVTCWLLGHGANPVFAANLETLEQMLRDRFMVLAEDGSWHVMPEHVN
jgi:hypothetical protein